MAWIETLSLERARGLLRSEYEAALRRAGRIWNVVSAMSLNPPVLRTSMALYRSIMYGRSPLSRGQREMLATVVSVANGCLY